MNKASEYNNLKDLSLTKLRQEWSLYWRKTPHLRIGRKMLEDSLIFKLREQNNHGLTREQQRRLDKFVVSYKRNPKYFSQNRSLLKPGVQLIRHWKGRRHVVTVTEDGFNYGEERYTSLSQIANQITGTRWNGWVFFGVKKAGVSS